MGKRWFVAVAVLLGILMGTPGFAEEERALVGYWRFDEGEREIVKDFSGQGNHGTLIRLGEHTRWVEGRSGQALKFSGTWPDGRENGGAIIKNMGRYDFSRGITIEAWIKPGDKFVREHFNELVTNTVADRGPGFRFNIFFNSLNFRSGDGQEVGTAAAGSRPALHPVHRKNIWHHVAATYDGSVFRVFVNGEEAGVSAENQILTPGRDIITIGSYNGGLAYPFNGTIDEVKIFNYARSARDILMSARLD